MGDIYHIFWRKVKTWRRYGLEDNIKISLKNKTQSLALDYNNTERLSYLKQ